MQPPSRAPRGTPARFETTHWSVVLAAARTHSPEAEKAMEALCVAYRYPLYAYARRLGHSREESEDLTQSFFAERVLNKVIFKGVCQDGGKFRTWLLNSFQNFMRNDWERQAAQKRGGGRPCLSLDLKDEEGTYLLEPGHQETPEKLYDRAWAMTVLGLALQQLRTSYEQSGEGRVFEVLAVYLPGALDPAPYHRTAEQLGKTEAAVKMAVCRLKREYGCALKAEVQRTLSENGNVDEELRHLRAIVGE